MTLATIGISGGRSSRRSSVRRSGSLAGATIDVWKAWLTGSMAVWKPRCWHCSTAAVDGGGGAADDRLRRGVDVGDDDVAVGLGDDLLDLVERREHGGHRPVVLHRQVGHLATAGADGFERGGERQRSGGDQGAVLAQAVAHHEVGHDAVGGEQPGEGEVDRQHGGLGDLGLAQVRLGRGDGVGVGGVDEQVGRERAADQRRHDGVGLVERLGDDRLDVAERRPACWRTASPGRCRGRRPSAPARCRGRCRGRAGPSSGPAARRRPAPARPCRPGRRRRRSRWRCARRRADRPRAARRARVPRPATASACTAAQARHERGLVVGAEHQRAAQRRLRRRRRRRPTPASTVAMPAVTGAGSDVEQLGAHRHDLLPVRGQAAGHVLLEHGVEVGAPEPERAHAGGADAVGGRIPRPQLGVHGERRRRPVDVGVQLLDVEAGRQLLVVDRHHRLEEAGGPGGGLEVADVRLGRADRDRSRPEVGAGERLADARHLDDVADPRRRAVALDHPARRG